MSESWARALVAESERLDALIPVAAGAITSEQLLALVRADHLRLCRARRRTRQESYFHWSKRAWDVMRSDPTATEAQVVLDEWWTRRKAAWPSLRLSRQPRYVLQSAIEAQRLNESFGIE